MSQQASAPNGKIEIKFLHPGGGKSFGAAIGPATTGEQALKGLRDKAFIGAEGHALTHARTKKSLPLSASLVENGVQDGDEILVSIIDRGASDMSQQASAPNGKIEIKFLHPSGGKSFGAAIGPATTGEQALKGLRDKEFIGAEGHTLTHTRTKRSLPLSASLVENGVQDGDEILVCIIDKGA